ncbi:MAG: alkane 1-monooxygenase [Albidovulum sp.]
MNKPLIDHPRLAFLRHPAAHFAAASLSPAVFLLIGAVFGGFWALFGFLWITLFLSIADRLGRRFGKDRAAPEADIWLERLPLALGLLHFPMLLFAVFALTGGTGLGLGSWVLSFLGFGLWFGQVSNSTAHELIHRTDRWSFRLGMWIYISLLFGHHTSAHRLVHHRFAATADDPNTAQAGESFYAFLVRAWPGGFIAGYEMEKARQDGRPAWLQPYTVYLAGAAGFVLIIAAGFGIDGFLAYLLLCAHTQVQLLLSDYVQHYGLERQETGLDSYEPFGPAHSWDAPDLFSGLMMLHAPRHADHHLHPARPYTALELSPGGKAPLLPFSLPAMATLALIPYFWHRIMDRRLNTWKRQNS